MVCRTDLLIIGGGPAGMSAAINAASEGLSVLVLDAATILGGQARESNAIENYLGFPDGVTGDKLMSMAVSQARKFGNIQFICPSTALDIERTNDGNILVTTEDYQEYEARSVILANGLSYRRLNANNLGAVMGRGAYYGAPISAMPTNTKCNVAIVGGANSAGQAAVKLASNTKARIMMFIRKQLDSQMSDYLVQRIRASPNIEVCEGCEVVDVDGRDWLTHVTYRQGNNDTQVSMHYLFIFIGAQPRTMWLRQRITLDEDRYVITGSGLTGPTDKAGRQPLFYETSMMGVFAAGDVRAHSIKRIAAAIGEGSAVVAMVHQYLAMEK